MMIKKIVILFVATMNSISFQTRVAGQQSLSSGKDTVIIKEVIITGRSNFLALTGFKQETVDTAIRKDYSHGSLADLLAAKSLLFIKSYGTGGIATLSFRGIGAGHTRISWNDININNPMLGQADLSLIPAAFIDDIRIRYGGASMELSNGGLGGAVNLETKPEWRKTRDVIFNSSFGSYGRFNGVLSLKTGNAFFQSVTKGFFQHSRNDFRYLNTQMNSEPFWETRKNNEISQQGFMQEIYFRRDNNSVSAKLWYQSASRKIPVPMIVYQSEPGEKQLDESFRTLVNYNHFIGSNDLNIDFAFISDRLNYSNPVASIDSRNLARTLVLKTGLKTSIGDRTKIRFNLNEELNIISSNNYSGEKTRNTLTLTATAERYFNRKLGTYLLIRQIIRDNKLLIPDFSAGVEYKILPENALYLKTNISKNSRMPTLNDMYWIPGGNPDLKNEFGYSGELSIGMGSKISSPFRYRTEFTLFRNEIKEMIHWHPGQYSYWTADNIRSVTTYGFESSSGFAYSHGNLSAGLETEYSFTKAFVSGPLVNQEIEQKQLLYVPVHQISSVVRACYKRIQSSMVTRFTGKRFITVDNSQYLPAYIVSDLNLGIKISAGKSTFETDFIIENIFDVNYQSIAWYPMPGRSFLIKLVFQIKK